MKTEHIEQFMSKKYHTQGPPIWWKIGRDEGYLAHFYSASGRFLVKVLEERFSVYIFTAAYKVNGEGEVSHTRSQIPNVS